MNRTVFFYQSSRLPVKKKGFTLVELSIVLVIIGLLIGGILVAQSMINTAKTQQLIRLADQYLIAARNFKTTYGYFPGDYPGPGFDCPGNGNGTISFHLGESCGIGPGYYNMEGTNFFVHLSKANMIPAKLNYRNSGSAEITSPVPGGNVPAGPDKNSYFRVQQFYTDGHGDSNVVEMMGDITAAVAQGVGSSFMLYNKLCTTDPATSWAGSDRYPCPAVTASTAAAIDIKIDDGFAGTGSFIGNGGLFSAYCGNPPGDHHAQSYPGLGYYPNSKAIVCTVGWKIQD